MDPREIHEALVPEIKEALLYVAAGYPIRRIGQELEALSEYFQALGICHILETVDLDQFRENLVRSAYARRYFLRKSREERNDADLRLALGRTEAFLDAVAAHHLSLAREIATLSIDTWRPSWEYEDDFCYYFFLQHLILRDPAVESELRDILIRFDKVVGKGDSPRLDICRALLNRNGDAFHASLVALMEQRREELQNLLERMLEPDPKTCVCWARSFVSIEGLALLRIAELQGITPVEPGEELPLCPSLALLPVSDRDYIDMFEGIERELGRGR